MGEYDAVWVFLISTVFVGFIFLLKPDQKAQPSLRTYQTPFQGFLEKDKF